MATKSVERALIDTNVLIDATDTRRPRHTLAVELLERRPGLVLCAQIAREYLAVATRPLADNGLGLPLSGALANVAEFRRVARMLPEEKPSLQALLKLLGEVPCLGKTIHDAALVAAMRVNSVRVLITSNPAHFSRFGALIEVEPLS